MTKDARGDGDPVAAPGGATQVGYAAPAASAAGTEPTLAAGSETPAASAGAVTPLVRAARGEDYRELVPVDPQHYVVGDEIAKGGMGRILAARDRRLGRPVAIKELLIATGDLRARFEREARITATLQHPAIVSILEAGAWPSGEPFFAMKLVVGESLDKAVKARTSLAERLGLLPNVIAAVDALAYAHTRRVIHRDLKPANILVGEFGETVVIDWGLAKDLSEPNGTPEIAVGPYRDPAQAVGETLAGSVMGTPAYMPIEQAQGQPLDERADVYALGALLYHVLCGHPPHVGDTANAVLHKVIHEPVAPIATRVPGVPPDLVTIVTKAMAHDAADRYPTANELADDLKKFQTGQLVGSHHYSLGELVRRWLRRHRAEVSVAIAALTVLVVLGALAVRRILHAEHVAEEQSARAEAARAVADDSRARAEELVGFMLVSLHDRLTPLGRLDLLDEAAKKAAGYYDRRDSLDDADLGRRALAQRNLGDVLSAQGHTDAALREYRASAAIDDGARREGPDEHGLAARSIVQPRQGRQRAARAG